MKYIIKDKQDVKQKSLIQQKSRPVEFYIIMEFYEGDINIAQFLPFL